MGQDCQSLLVSLDFIRFETDVPSCLAHDMTNDMLNETVLA